MPVSDMRAIFPWLPSNLAQMLTDLWAEHGDMQVALAHLRQTPEHTAAFPGIRREDGSLRMTEQEYFAHRDGFRRELLQWGLNPQHFETMHTQLIEGDVGVPEFQQRLTAKVTGVLNNIPQVREEFGEFYGIDAMDETALIGAALNPQIGLDLLQGRITAAQVSAEASAAGFVRSRTQAERLVGGGGLDQMAARQLFSRAAQAVPRTERFVERFNEDGEFGIDEFEEAAVFGNAEQRRRMERLHASEESLFNQGGQVQRDQTGLTGLRPR